jgi:hypothetical protein
MKIKYSLQDFQNVHVAGILDEILRSVRESNGLLILEDFGYDLVQSDWRDVTRTYVTVRVTPTWVSLGNGHRKAEVVQFLRNSLEKKFKRIEVVEDGPRPEDNVTFFFGPASVSIGD